MKKFLSFIVLTVAINSFGQITERKDVDRKPSGNGKPVYFVDNVTMDQRALAHYKDEQIKQMPTYKKLQVNNYYQKSYELFIPANGSYKAANFDISKYESYRKEDTRARVNIENAGGAYAILLSRNEMQIVNEKIKEENSK